MDANSLTAAPLYRVQKSPPAAATLQSPGLINQQGPDMTSPTLAFLGIGLMGKPMASRLARAGFTVRAWNRTPAKAEALRAVGAQPQQELADAVAGADIVISMLESGAVVAQVIDAALPALKPGALWIDMSSTQKGEATAFHARLQAHGVSFIDSPVSGG
jgi:3-hydroxyisobutyrate dehydrogenase-like beta-hydroxyacid dehydrogenase